ncbi:16864_t:CDS:1, partial [Entrophospora sp. SA101]
HNYGEFDHEGLSLWKIMLETEGIALCEYEENETTTNDVMIELMMILLFKLQIVHIQKELIVQNGNCAICLL